MHHVGLLRLLGRHTTKTSGEKRWAGCGAVLSIWRETTYSRKCTSTPSFNQAVWFDALRGG
jgi:hypothetical protein